MNSLLSFRASNHASISELVELQLTTSANRKDAWPIPGNKIGVLPAAAIFGANASGKSSLLSAFSLMTQAMIYSHRALDSNDPMPRAPHRFGDWETKPTYFGAEFLINGERHSYSFSFTSERVVFEELLIFKSSRPQVWYRRDGDTYSFPGARLGSIGQQIKKITRPNSLFLSAGELLGQPELSNIFRWAQNIEFVTNMPGPYYPSRTPESQIAKRIQNEETRREFVSLAKFADLGITDVRPIFETTDIAGVKTGEEARLVFTHHGSHSVDFSINDESSGTWMFIQYADAISRLRENGGILVVDELDHSLHPSLTQELVRLFQDPALNNELAQIIFTTHDTTLLDSSLDWPLMKDQVWFTEKSPEGSTQLIPLLDYRLTGRENIEKMYRHGRFGAIPIIDHTQLISDESLNFDSVKS